MTKNYTDIIYISCKLAEKIELQGLFAFPTKIDEEINVPISISTKAASSGKFDDEILFSKSAIKKTISNKDFLKITPKIIDALHTYNGSLEIMQIPENTNTAKTIKRAASNNIDHFEKFDKKDNLFSLLEYKNFDKYALAFIIECSKLISEEKGGADSTKIINLAYLINDSGVDKKQIMTAMNYLSDLPDLEDSYRSLPELKALYGDFIDSLKKEHDKLIDSAQKKPEKYIKKEEEPSGQAAGESKTVEKLEAADRGQISTV